MKSSKIKIYSDGGSRGNPGPAACAFLVKKAKRIVYKKAFYLGRKTNNQAEYIGVVNAINWLKDNKSTVKRSKINFYLDSELAVKQLSGIYKVKNKKLKSYVSYILKSLEKLEATVKFVHIPREKNTLADKLLNEELDSKTGKAKTEN